MLSPTILYGEYKQHVSDGLNLDSLLVYHKQYSRHQVTHNLVNDDLRHSSSTSLVRQHTL